VKGARARSETPAKPPWAVLPSECGGPELCCLLAQPRGLAAAAGAFAVSKAFCSLTFQNQQNRSEGHAGRGFARYGNTVLVI